MRTEFYRFAPIKRHRCHWSGGNFDGLKIRNAELTTTKMSFLKNKNVGLQINDDKCALQRHGRHRQNDEQTTDDDQPVAVQNARQRQEENP